MIEKYSKDYYAALGIKFPSSSGEIKAAYRKLAKFAHPDAGGTVEQMQILNEAYHVLIDPVSKITYDLWYEKVFIKRKATSGTREKKTIVYWLTIDYMLRSVYTEEITNPNPTFLNHFKAYVQKDGKLYVVQEKRRDRKLHVKAVSAIEWNAAHVEAVSKFSKPTFSMLAYIRKKFASFFELSFAERCFYYCFVSMFTILPLIIGGLAYLYTCGELSAIKALSKTPVKELHAIVAKSHNGLADVINVLLVITSVIVIPFFFLLWDYKRNKK